MPHASLPARSLNARPWGDLVAVGLSAACMVHCLAWPLAVAFLPVLGPLAGAEWIHWLFVGLAAPLSFWLLAWPPRGGARALPLGLAVAGVALLAAGAAGWPRHELETPVTVLGASLVAGAHLINWRRRLHRCRTD